MLKIKYVSLCYFCDEYGKMIPCLNFYIEEKRLFSTLEVDLSYNPMTEKWSGNSLCYGEECNLEEEDIKKLVSFIYHYKNLIYSYKEVVKYFQYCFENKINNLGLSFISEDAGKYLGIHSDGSDYYCEYFNDLYGYLSW